MGEKDSTFERKMRERERTLASQHLSSSKLAR